MSYLSSSFFVRTGLCFIKLKSQYTCNPINLFATVVVVALPSTNNRDLAADLFHGQVSLIEMLHGARCCRERRVQIPYSNFADTCDLWLHLRCSHHYYRALLGRLGSEEEHLPCRHPCSSAHVGHHLFHQDGRCSMSHHHVVVRGAGTVRTPDTCSESLRRHRAWTWRW
jgi:hypothetical protein